MLSRKAKHLALTANNRILLRARFFAVLRCAQNDKMSYILISKTITIIIIDCIGQFELVTNNGFSMNLLITPFSHSRESGNPVFFSPICV
jgi:hypothetical protein